jgi:hypothetical protein
MARWTAKCWLGSSAGYQDCEVDASTINGAKQQLERIYGAEQIINLREVRSGSSSSYSGGDVSGWAWIIGIVFAIWLCVEYWYIVVPILAVLIALAIYGSMK